MKYKIQDKIYKKCNSKNLVFHNICEVGVYLPETLSVIDFITEGVDIMLVEPHPVYVQKINEYFNNYHQDKKISIYPYAIYDYNGKIELVQRNSSTFIGDLPASPALVNDNYVINDKDKITVECRKFSEIDNGTIDLLIVDIEGSEWFVIKHMVSRPKVILLETHGKYFVNPYIREITGWMKENNYRIWFKTKSNTIYYKDGVLKVSLGEKADLIRMNIFLYLRRLKKNFRFQKFTTPRH